MKCTTGTMDCIKYYCIDNVIQKWMKNERKYNNYVPLCDERYHGDAVVPEWM